MSYLLILLGLTFVGGAAALTIRAVALPRIRAVARLEQIGGYGLVQGQAEVVDVQAPGGGVHQIATTFGRLAAGRGRVDLVKVRKMLLAAGFYRTQAETVLGYRILLTAIAVPLALTADFGTALGVFQAVGLVVFGWFGPYVALKRLATFRSERMDDALPDLVDLLVVTVEAGLSFGASLQKATDRMDGPLGDELRLAMQEQRMGLPIVESLNNLLGRCETQSMRAFVQSIAQAETLGVSIGQMLRGLAVDMRKRRRARAEERANKAPVKMLFPLVFLMFPALLVVLLGPGMLKFMEAFG